MIKNEVAKTSTNNISSVVEKQLVTPVAAATAKVFSTIEPLFQNGRTSDIDIQFSGNGEKTFEHFQNDVSNLATVLLNSLSDAVEICEYNGNENENFTKLEYSILNSTVPLLYKRVKKLYVEYNLYGSHVEKYKPGERYSRDEMVYNSKFHKKKLRASTLKELSDCFKILSEIKYNKENPYASYANMEPTDIFNISSAFVDSVNGDNGSVCYRVVSDSYLGYFFKIEIQVPLFFSEEQSTRFSRIDIEESFLRRKYKKIMQERMYFLKKEACKKLEVRGSQNITNVKEEEALIDTFINASKEIINSIENGDLKLSSVDKNLKILADTVAQLNILIDVAKEYYGDYEGIDVPEGYFIDTYEASMLRMMKKKFKQSGLPKMTGDLSLKSDVPYININIEGIFSDALSPVTIRSIVKSAGKPSEYRLNVDMGRQDIKYSNAKLENGKAVFTAISNTFAATDKDKKAMQDFRVPGNKQGTAKLYIATDNFEIVAKSGVER